MPVFFHAHVFSTHRYLSSKVPRSGYINEWRLQKDRPSWTKVIHEVVEMHTYFPDWKRLNTMTIVSTTIRLAQATSATTWMNTNKLLPTTCKVQPWRQSVQKCTRWKSMFVKDAEYALQRRFAVTSVGGVCWMEVTK
jgi:hypothetical protein